MLKGTHELFTPQRQHRRLAAPWHYPGTVHRSSLPSPPHLCCSSSRRLPLPELLLLCLDEPQIPPVVYLRLEALLLFLLRLVGRFLPEHLVRCLIKVGEHTNRDDGNCSSEWGAAWLQLIALFIGSCVVLSVIWHFLLAIYRISDWKGDMGSCFFALPLSKKMPWK